MRTTTVPALLFLFATFPVSARPAFYWATEGGTHVAADYLSFEDADFDSTEGDVGGTRSYIAAQYDFSSEQGWVLGFGHEYNALDIADDLNPPPQTNGDLHNLHLATQWRTGAGPGTLRLALAPALSVSSNGLKNPDELDSDALQLWGAVLYSRPTKYVDWVLGAAHDYRFGEGKVYPVAGVAWRGENMALRAVYPDLEFTAKFSPHWRIGFSLSPDGNEWLAYDRDLEDRDEFQREAWQGALTLAYRLTNGISLGVSAGYQWGQQWEFRRQDDTLARLDSDDCAFYGIHLGWYRQ